MNSTNKTKEQLLKEVELLDTNIAKLEKSETKRKRAEGKLKESEEKYRTLFSHMTNAFAYHKMVFDENNQPIDYVFLEVNDAFEKNTGLKRESIIGKKVTEVIPGIEDTEPDLIGIYGKVALSGEPTKFELFFEIFDRMYSVSAYCPQRGYFVAVFDEITERKQMEEAIKESEERFRGLTEAAFDAIFISEKGVCLEQNSTAEKMFGYTSLEAVGRLGTEWIVPEDREKVMNNMMSGYEEPYEATALRKDGTTFPSEIQGRMMHYKGRNVRATSLRDISARKQAEEALKTSEEKYRFLFESVPDIITTINEQGTIISANNSVKKILGYEPSELVGKPVEILAPEELRTEQKENIIKAIKKGFLESQETIRVAKDGTRIPVDISVFTSKDSAGNLLGVSAIMRDITERKQGEKEIERLSRFPNESPDPMIRVSNEGVVYYTNKPGDRLLKKWKTSVGGKLPAGIMQPIINIIAADDSYKFEAACDEKVFEINCAAVEDYNYINLYARDITDRKRAEGGLKDSEERYRALFENSSEFLFTLDLKGNFTNVNQSAVKLSGYTKAELLKMNFKDYTSTNNYRKLFRSLHNVFKTGKPLRDFPVEAITKDKTVKYFETCISPLKEGENIIGFQGSSKDITKRLSAEQAGKQAEVALRRSEEKFKTMFNESPIGIELYKADGTQVTANNAALKMFGIQDESEIYGFNIFDGTSLDVEKKEKLRKGERVDYQSVFDFEKVKELQQYKTDRIGKAYLDYIITPLLDVERHSIQGYLLQVQDITKRKQVEEKIKEKSLELEKQFKRSEEQRITTLSVLSDLNETTEDLHYEINVRKQTEKILLKNEFLLNEAQRIATLGSYELDIPSFYWISSTVLNNIFGIDDNYDKSLEGWGNIVHSDDREDMLSYFNNNVLKEHQKFDREYRIVRISDNQERWVHGLGELDFDDEGKPVKMIGTIQDITAGKEAERRLRESRNQLRSLAERLQMIREEERASIAREIHDDLGQTLTALKMDISWMKKNTGMSEEIRAEKINAMLGLTDSTIQTVKRIATALRPGILDDLGLIPAIEWEAEEFRKRSDMKCNLQITAKDVSIEDTISIAVFRIFQESLTNIARHSGATMVDVSIKEEGNLLKMEITDNGVGISEEQISSSKSLGLMGMNERVSFFGGRIIISSPAEGGTNVMVYIPIIKAK